jgi:hypothetical protein
MKCDLVLEPRNKPEIRCLGDIKLGMGSAGLWAIETDGKYGSPHIVIGHGGHDRVVLRIQDGEVHRSTMVNVDMKYLGPCSITVTMDGQ